MFAGKAWKIVRINGDGSIRLIYNGTSPTARATSVFVATGYFKASDDDDNTYVGYMYGGAGQSTYAYTHTNATNSSVKAVVDTWYNNNLSSYASKLTDAGFCGDRSMQSGQLGYAKNSTNYGAWPRIYANKTPVFDCLNSSLDLYTLATNNLGNKKLIYPIGLITADEIAYAGGVYNTNNYTYYLQTGDGYWTMSPAYFNSFANEFFIDYNGYLSVAGTLGPIKGARPVINLKANTLVTSGTGTLTDPWIIQ